MEPTYNHKSAFNVAAAGFSGAQVAFVRRNLMSGVEISDTCETVDQSE